MSDSEKIRCEDVVVGDWISPTGNRACNHYVHRIEEDVRILGLVTARRLHVGNETEVLWVKNWGRKKPMRRRVSP